MPAAVIVTGTILNMLKIQNLTKRFGSIAAVDNLNIEVGAGEIYALIWPWMQLLQTASQIKRSALAQV